MKQVVVFIAYKASLTYSPACSVELSKLTNLWSNLKVPIKKRIACLANSYMGNYRCVAGKELTNGKPGKWIRVTIARGKEGVPKSAFQRMQLLDIVDMPLVGSCEKDDHQKENCFLDCGGSRLWRKVDRMPRNTLAKLVDPEKPLWIDGFSTNSGKNDMVPYSEIIGKVNNSLRFIKVTELTLFSSKSKVTGRFNHANTDYQFTVTDPDYRELDSKKCDEENDKMSGCFLTVSLAGRYKETDACHKLIAAIIPCGEPSKT